MYSVDLNCDLGESFGAYRMGMDEAMIPLITSANVACGFHAGDPAVMHRTVRLCRQYNVAVGAHPGYPDLVGFGRRAMNVSPEQVADDLLYQIGALKVFCDLEGTPLHHVKLHGALYNQAAKEPALASAVCQVIRAVDPGLKLMAQGGTAMQAAAVHEGIPFICEVFADRAYQSNGLLVPRGMEGAMITDESLAVSRVIRMIRDHKVQALDGTDTTVQADSVCVHGDGEKALLFARKIREALLAENIRVHAWGNTD